MQLWNMLEGKVLKSEHLIFMGLSKQESEWSSKELMLVKNIEWMQYLSQFFI